MQSRSRSPTLADLRHARAKLVAREQQQDKHASQGKAGGTSRKKKHQGPGQSIEYRVEQANMRHFSMMTAQEFAHQDDEGLALLDRIREIKERDGRLTVDIVRSLRKKYTLDTRSPLDLIDETAHVPADLDDACFIAEHKDTRMRDFRPLETWCCQFSGVWNITMICGILKLIEHLKPHINPAHHSVVLAVLKTLTKSGARQRFPAQFAVCKLQWDRALLNLHNSMHVVNKSLSHIWSVIRPLADTILPIQAVDRLVAGKLLPASSS